jgi:hypothetical protein
MIFTDIACIYHPDEQDRYVVIEYKKSVTDYDDRTNSATVTLVSYEIIEEYDESSWLTWKTVQDHVE